MAKRKDGGSIWGTILPLFIALMALGEIGMLIMRPSMKNMPHARCPPQVICSKRRPVSIPPPVPPPTVLVGGAGAKAAGGAAEATGSTDAVVVPAPSQGLHPVTGTQLPYYDIMIVLFAIASEHDLLRMDAARDTWLSWKDPTWTFHWMVVLCQDDPGLGPVGCKPGPGCARAKQNVVIVPCKQGYSTIVTKSTEGFRYLSNHFSFKYVVKADIDTMVDMRCVAKALIDETKNCPSFGMGRWREAGGSKVFRKTDPGAGKYPNEPFYHDTGFSHYPPYMVGWLTIWSADVAHFIGMAGLQAAQMPQWKSSWTIDDAAIGSFVVGLDMCRLNNPCHIVTDVEYEQFEWHWKGDVTGHELVVVPDGPVKGFRGPLRDDVPGVGGLANTWVDTVEKCAQLCRDHPECNSFEHSPTVGRRGEVKNCILDAGSHLSGAPYGDYSVYLKIHKEINPDVPVAGFEGPLDDDVPGLGDLENVFTQTLEECAEKCRQNDRCLSFEHSPSFRKTVGMKSCQLNSATTRAGTKCEDYSLYIKKT